MIIDTPLVEELFRCFRDIRKRHGRLPTVCWLSNREWRQLLQLRPRDALPNWQVSIMGVPIKPWRRRNAA